MQRNQLDENLLTAGNGPVMNSHKSEVLTTDSNQVLWLCQSSDILCRVIPKSYWVVKTRSGRNGRALWVISVWDGVTSQCVYR